MENEIAFTCHVCGLVADPNSSPTPAGYETLYKAVQEVNAAGFFTYVTRRMEAGQREIRKMLAAGIPADQLMGLLKGSISATPLRGTPPRVA